MSNKHHRRRRSWPRTIMLLVFVAAALAGVYHCLIQRPQLAAGSQPETSENSASPVSNTRSNSARKEDFYTILLSGVDDGNGGSDTNILVGFDAANHSVTCVSIPRDSGMYIDGSARKVNSAYNLGGMNLLADTVSNALGIPVDFTVEVRLKGFAKLVDAIGGVDFDVPIRMDYDDPVQNLSIHFNKGMQHLDGDEALEVVRFRHNNDGSGYGSEDLGRIQTQQAFLKTVAKQTLRLSNLNKIDDFSKLFQKYVKTDLTVGNLAWLGKEVVNMGSDNIHFSTLDGKWSSARNLYMVDPDAALDLVNSSLNPYTSDRTTSDLDIPQ